MKVYSEFGSYINLWAGEKQGVGKSWCASLDVQRHLDDKFDFWLMDEESDPQSNANVFPEFLLDRDVSFDNFPKTDKSAHPILEAASDRPIIANCRAKTNELILSWLKKKQSFKFSKKLDVEMRYFFVSDLEPDSLSLFEPTAKMFSPYMDIVFVANYGRNQSGDHLFLSDEFQATLRQFETPVIQIEPFNPKLKHWMDEKGIKRQVLSWENLWKLKDQKPSYAEMYSYLSSFYEQIHDAERLSEIALEKRLSSPTGFSQDLRRGSTQSKQKSKERN